MPNPTTTWDELRNLVPEELRPPPGDQPAVDKRYGWKSDKSHLHWLEICTFQPDDVLAWQGGFGDRMVLPLRGSVVLFDHAFPNHPRAPAVAEADLDRPRKVGTLPPHHGGVESFGRVTPPSPDCLLGAANVLWNLPWPFTVVAGPGGCTALLMKRVVYLETTLPADSQLFQFWRTKRFWEREVPQFLRGNRLLEGLDAEALKGFLEKAGCGPENSLAWTSTWPPAIPAGEEPGGRSPQGPGSASLYDLPLPHHPRRSPRRFAPAPPANGATAKKDQLQADQARAESPQTESADPILFGPGHPPTGVYLILAGMVQLTRTLGGAGGREVVVNQLGAGEFIGPGHWQLGEKAPVTAYAVADAVVLHLPEAALQGVPAETRANIQPALDRCQETQFRRWEDVEAGRHYAPEGLAEEAAAKLLLATDGLLIDMDACSRCDQCVTSCSQTHGGVARFHRTNQQLQFGHWELARACTHCLGAPCQAVCPHGAITLLDGGLVHIHVTSRCVGCQKCVPACPFDVIVLHEPAEGHEAPSWDPKGFPAGVATKCDRCLTTAAAPACVTGCPYDAVQRGQPADLLPQLRTWATGYPEPPARPAGPR